MKKLFMLMLLSAPIFCMEQRSIPDNEMDEKYKEFQGKYEPTIGYFDTKKYDSVISFHETSIVVDNFDSHVSLEKPQKKIKPKNQKMPIKANPIQPTPMNSSKISRYEEKIRMSFAFSGPVVASLKDFFEEMQLNHPELFNGLFLTNFRRVPAITNQYNFKDKKVEKIISEDMVLWKAKSNIRCPFVIIEYIKK